MHGRVQGRDARLALTLTPTALRIEVTDAQGGRLPVRTPDADTDGESGRGLLLVTTLADAWGCDPPPGRQDGVGGVHPERRRAERGRRKRPLGHFWRGEDEKERYSVGS
nr:ATP-binding protein [Streptomyces sp. DH-12]